MLQYRNIILLFIISCITVAGLFILTDVYLNIRFHELRLYLQKSDSRESRIDHIQLLTKYNTGKKLYEKIITHDSAEAAEAKISILTADKTSYERIFFERYKYLSVPALFVINLNRFFIGKDPIRIIQDNKTSSFLDLAYYYERNNIYNKALLYYEKLLEEGNVDKEIRGGILLHQGFCNAMTGRYGTAEALYKKVIDEYWTEEIAITASILLTYLIEFVEEQQRVAKDGPDSLEKGKKLLSLFSCSEALAIFEKIRDKALPSEKSEINYYRARCFDELGMKEKSINTYLSVIAEEPNSKFAKLSNRRLYMIGSRLGDSGIKKLALNVNNNYKDEIIEPMIMSENIFKMDIEREDIINYNKIDNELLDRVEKISVNKDSTSLLNRRVRISTKDGSLFVGSVLESVSSHLSLMTSIGKVNINRSGILNIKIIDE